MIVGQLRWVAAAGVWMMASTGCSSDSEAGAPLVEGGTGGVTVQDGGTDAPILNGSDAGPGNAGTGGAGNGGTSGSAGTDGGQGGVGGVGGSGGTGGSGGSAGVQGDPDGGVAVDGGSENSDAATLPDELPDADTVDLPDGQVDGQASGQADAQADALLMLNEISPNISGAADLLELRVVSGGSLAGMRLEQQIATTTVLATLPSLTVATSDLIVVHLNPAIGVSTETLTKTTCSDAACYSGAWDVAGGITGITYSNQVLSIVTSNGTRMDAVPFARTISTTGAFVGDLQTIQNAGLWLPANCGGSACSYASTPTAIAISAVWDSVGTSPTGNSVHRSSTTDTNQASDWLVGAQAFGAP